MLFSIAFQSGLQVESATRISGAAFSLFLCFVFIFVKTENPTSQLYVVVKGMSSKMLAVHRTGYSDEVLIYNEDYVMHSCLLFSLLSLLSCKHSVSSAGVSPSSSNDSGLSNSKGF